MSKGRHAQFGNWSTRQQHSFLWIYSPRASARRFEIASKPAARDSGRNDIVVVLADEPRAQFSFEIEFKLIRLAERRGKPSSGRKRYLKKLSRKTRPRRPPAPIRAPPFC